MKLAAAFVWLTSLSVDVSVFSEAEARRYSRGRRGVRGSIRHRRGVKLRGTKRNRKGRRRFKRGGKKRGYYHRGSGKRRGVRRYKSRGKKRRR